MFAAFAFPRHHHNVSWLACVALAFATLFTPAGESPETLVLLDFEREVDLDRLHWRCHTLYSLSGEHVTHGESSLLMRLYPSAYPGLVTALGKMDWRGWERFCFDVFNPQSEVVSMTLRVDDRRESKDYHDRFNETLSLSPGTQTVCVPLTGIRTSGTGRNVDLRNIYGFLLFALKPKDNILLWLDNVRLER